MKHTTPYDTVATLTHSNVHLFKVNKKYKVNNDGRCFDISSVDLERLEKLN